MYDLIIIGAGPTGMTAALYAGRFNLKTLVIGEMPGGLMVNTDIIENYPGFLKVSGVELTMKLQEQVQALDIEIKMEKVEKVDKLESRFKVKSSSGEHEGKMLIFATGGVHRHLGIPGEEEFKNHGVSFCANCDAPIFKERVVAVIGGSDTAARYALLCSEYASKVYVFYRGDKMRAEPSLVNSLLEKENIEIVYNVNVKELKGDENLKEAILDNGKNYQIDGIFVAIGQIPQSELAKNIGVKIDEYGAIIIDRESRTNVKGVYAAGDVTSTIWKQIIIGNAEGAFAAFSAYEDFKMRQ